MEGDAGPRPPYPCRDFQPDLGQRRAKWKAVKFRPIMDLRKFFDRTFDAELAAELADLG